MWRLDNFLDSRKRYIEALKQARITRGKRLWELKEARRFLPTREIKEAIEPSPEVALASFQQTDTVKLPEVSIVQPVIKEIERPEMPEFPGEPKSIEPEIPRAETSEFIFKLPNGNEVGRAGDLNKFFEFVRRGPLDSILYHVNEEHFSPWLESKGYKKLAKKVKNIKGNTKKTRKRLLKLISRNL